VVGEQARDCADWMPLRSAGRAGRSWESNCSGWNVVRTHPLDRERATNAHITINRASAQNTSPSGARFAARGPAGLTATGPAGEP